MNKKKIIIIGKNELTAALAVFLVLATATTSLRKKLYNGWSPIATTTTC